MNIKATNSPHQDPLYQLGRNALRQTNVAVLPHMLKKLEQKIQAKTASSYMDAEFRILAAEIARSLGKESFGLSLLQTVLDNPPAVGIDLLSRAQRVRAALFLDTGDVESAKALSEIIDASVIENSEARGEAMISREDRNIGVETYLLMAEISLYSLDSQAVGEHLISAATRLSEMEQVETTTRLSAFDSQQKTIYCAELRYKIHLWRAVLRIVTGDEEGFTLLRDLADDLSNDTKADRRLLSRVRALLGDFDIEKDAPVGISRNEAMRLFALCSRNVVESIELNGEEDLLELDITRSPQALNPNPHGVPQTEIAVASPVKMREESLPPVMNLFLEKQTQTNTHMEKMFEQMTEILQKLPIQSAEQNMQKMNKRPFAFGGGFAFFDLVTQLGNAEASKFTGYFQVQWSPDMVESSVLAGNLDPLAREGEGFIFVKDGVIIDATIKNYDPPEDFQAGMDGAEADAKRSLTVMIQVGIGQKLDCLPDGFGSGYPSMAVKERKARLKFGQFQLAVLIQERDEELQ